MLTFLLRPILSVSVNKPVFIPIEDNESDTSGVPYADIDITLSKSFTNSARVNEALFFIYSYF